MAFSRFSNEETLSATVIVGGAVWAKDIATGITVPFGTKISVVGWNVLHNDDCTPKTYYVGTRIEEGCSCYQKGVEKQPRDDTLVGALKRVV